MRSSRTEIENLKKDIAALKSNGSTFMKDIRHDGGDIIRESFSHLKNSGNQRFQKMEDAMRNNPNQTLALGVVGGMILSYFLNRRKE